MTDIVSGGEGSELYRVAVPDAYAGLDIDDASARLRLEHRATLVAISRGPDTIVNPSAGFRVERGDFVLVVAESLGTLAPLRTANALGAARNERSAFQHGSRA